MLNFAGFMSMSERDQSFFVSDNHKFSYNLTLAILSTAINQMPRISRNQAIFIPILGKLAKLIPYYIFLLIKIKSFLRNI